MTSVTSFDAKWTEFRIRIREMHWPKEIVQKNPESRILKRLFEDLCRNERREISKFRILLDSRARGKRAEFAISGDSKIRSDFEILHHSLVVDKCHFVYDVGELRVQQALDVTMCSVPAGSESRVE